MKLPWTCNTTDKYDHHNGTTGKHLDFDRLCKEADLKKLGPIAREMMKRDEAETYIKLSVLSLRFVLPFMRLPGESLTLTVASNIFAEFALFRNSNSISTMNSHEYKRI